MVKVPDRPATPFVRLRRLALFLLKLGVTLGCFYYLFRNFEDLKLATPWGSKSLHTVIYWSVCGFVAAGVSFALTVYRWSIMLAAQGLCVPMSRLCYLSLLGVLFGIFSLGAIATDMVKIIPLCRAYPDQKWNVGVSVIADHLSGLFALILLVLTFTATTFSALQSMGLEARVLLLFGVVALLGSFIFIAVTFWLSSPSMQAVAKKISPKFLAKPGFQNGIAAYDLIRTRWRHSLLAMAVSVPIHLIYFLSFYCGLRAVGVEVGVTPVLAAMPIVDFAASLPISLSGFGVRESAFGLLLEAFAQIPPAYAAAGSLLGFLLNAAWGGFGALWMLVRRERPTTVPAQAE